MKFLLIQLYQTGDVVLTTHIPRELKKACPGAEIDFLTFAANAPVLANNPDIRNVITTSRKGKIKELLRVIKEVRKNRYDAVLDFHNNPRTAYITFLSGAKYKVGYETSPRRFFYNTLPHRLGGYPPMTKLSLIAPFTDIFNPDDYDVSPVVFTSEKADSEASEALKNAGITDDDFFVTVSPTHKRDTRRWNLKGFMDTAVYLTQKYSAKVMITYGPGEKEYITDSYPVLPENIFLMPQLSLEAFSALIKKAKLHIGNDSAPHHIATAMGVPTFIILGSSDSLWVMDSPKHTWTSMELECQPCRKSFCRISPEIPCMSELTFEMIKDRLNTFIKTQVTGD